MTCDDFDIIISTTDSPRSAERRERLSAYFRQANITRYEWDEEPVCTDSPIPLLAGWYGCAKHFANILSRLQGRHIIFMEDDAVFSKDFQSRMNHHLVQLPDDWGIFAAGHAELTGDIHPLANTDLVTAEGFAGMQCLAIKSGEWRDQLIDDINTHELYKYYGAGHGYDRSLVPWCRKHNVGMYFSAKSFVGQGGCLSIAMGIYIPIVGLDESLLVS